MLLVGCVVTSSVWAANDPFVGKWKVNPSKSKLNDEMKVEVAGANRYTFTFAFWSRWYTHHCVVCRTRSVDSRF